MPLFQRSVIILPCRLMPVYAAATYYVIRLPASAPFFFVAITAMLDAD